VSVLPALVPVGSEQNQDFSAMLVRSLQHARETVHQRSLNARVVHLVKTWRDADKQQVNFDLAVETMGNDPRCFKDLSLFNDHQNVESTPNQV